MPSFGFLATLTTLAFAAFSSAAPSNASDPTSLVLAALTEAPAAHSPHHARDIPDADVVGPAHEIAATLTKIHSEKVGDITRRCNGGCRSLPAILIDVNAQLAPHCSKLSGLADVDISLQVIAPICKEISGIVLSASAEIKLLIGQPLDTILLLSGKVCALSEVAKLVGDLLCLLLGALGAVVKVCAAVKLVVILPLLSAIG
ncbi:hypothetical protein ONZ45_g10441 [Pleurotus djamor]|nr:hypothetical protein ONZ45_g10441 [Pleurotus djamor]